MAKNRKQEVTNVWDYLENLGLDYDSSFQDSIGYADLVQKERKKRANYRALRLTRSSVFLGAAFADDKVKNALEASGLIISRFLEDIKIPNFALPESDYALYFDVDIHVNVASSISTYTKAFKDRKTIDALGLTWGLLRSGEGKFTERFRRSGGDLGLAVELLGAHIEPEKKKERQLRPRLHRDRWASKDELGFDLYAEAISQFILHKNTKPPLVIGIEAPWGQGKTTLMRMVQRKLDPDHPDLLKEKIESKSSGQEGSNVFPEKELNSETESKENQEIEKKEITYGDLIEMKSEEVELKPHEEKEFLSVWFNAWKYQNSEQIWAGLAHCIISQLSDRLSFRERQRFMLQLQLRRVNWEAVEQEIRTKAIRYLIPRLLYGALLAIGVLGLSLFFAIEWMKSPWSVAGGSVIPVLLSIFGGWKTWTWSKSKALGENLEGKFREYIKQPDYSGRLGFLHLVEEDMKRIFLLLTDEEHPAVIFVDDLDRCSPENVAEIIEAINLFLAGDFPNCIFLLGLDAEVVAASMEVAHEDIVNKLSNRRGELGWRFMDKFIQLPFVIPRLTPKQGEKFLGKMFGISKLDERDEEYEDVQKKADYMIEQLESETLNPESAANEIGKISGALHSSDPDHALSIQQKIIELGVERYREDDPSLAKLFDPVCSYLTGNPRTIKRVVNLFRFHYFTSIVRRMQNLPAAKPEKLACLVIMIVRWPDFVRWIQAERTRAMKGNEEAGEAGEPRILYEIIKIAKRIRTLNSWIDNLKKKGLGEQRWINDQDLFLYLKSNPHSIEAGKYGIW